MKLLWIFIFSVLLVLACNKDSKTSDTETGKDNKTSEKQGAGPDSKPQNANDKTSGGDEIKNLTYDIKNIPNSVKYDGKLVAGASWTDKNGDNMVLITETDVKKQSGDNRMKELFGYHFIIKGDDSKTLWRINDFINDCPLDIAMDYMPKSISVTDLDNNGMAESTFLYKMSCKGDVSPDDMKLIMHEGENKYAIRGSMTLIANGEVYGKGTMNVDPSFDKAPKEFLDYAKSQWNKFETEKLGN